MNKRLKIVFMGTPEFALPSLKALDVHHDVVCVVTNPDKPKGRGGKVTSPCTKVYAESKGIDVLQPESVKAKEFYDALTSYGADVFVTCAYGKILPESIISIPKFGCINIHASLLPKYRGAAPLWHCIIDGEKETGITTMMTDVGMDTGDILLAREIDIPVDMTMGELHDVLAELGSVVIIETIDKLMDGTLKRIPQNHDEAIYAPMVTRETGRIDFKKSALDVHNLVRGTNPFPGSYCFVDGKKLKIWKTALVDMDVEDARPGEVVEIDQTGALVKAGLGVVRIIEVQGENAKRMHVWDYNNGHPMPPGTILN
ncbi:MAG TPA: methionyl-tRNA formyltransferase [Clostridia bacterium]|nr:methionyl-tRNA formyltransferase [Clostridia bacterium]